MGIFKTKDEKGLARDIAQEKKAVFAGETLQFIGRIPKGAQVKLTLKPNERMLNIQHDKTDIALPYDRIVSFTLESELTEKESRGKAFASNILNSGVLGKGLIGKAGVVAGHLAAQINILSTLAVLAYIDKSGEKQQLHFSRKYEIEHSILEEDVDYRDPQADEFEGVINRIIIKNQGGDMTEL